MSIRDIVGGAGPAVGAHHDGDSNVYMGHKILKLQDQLGQVQEDFFQLRSIIFKNCAVFVNGITKPPLREISLLVRINGGIFHPYQISGSTTHFVCDHLPASKVYPVFSNEIIPFICLK